MKAISGHIRDKRFEIPEGALVSMGVISVGNLKNRSWKASLLMISHVRKWILLQRTWQKKKILLLNFFPLHD